MRVRSSLPSNQPNTLSGVAPHRRDEPAEVLPPLPSDGKVTYTRWFNENRMVGLGETFTAMCVLGAVVNFVGVLDNPQGSQAWTTALLCLLVLLLLCLPVVTVAWLSALSCVSPRPGENRTVRQKLVLSSMVRYRAWTRPGSRSAWLQLPMMVIALVVGIVVPLVIMNPAARPNLRSEPVSAASVRASVRAVSAWEEQQYRRAGRYSADLAAFRRSLPLGQRLGPVGATPRLLSVTQRGQTWVLVFKRRVVVHERGQPAPTAAAGANQISTVAPETPAAGEGPS